MKLKRVICAIAVLTVIISCAGCGRQSAVTNNSSEGDTLKTVTGTEVRTDDERTQIFDELGFGIVIPEDWMDKYQGLFPVVTETGLAITYVPQEVFNHLDEDATDEQLSEIFTNAIPAVKIFIAEKGDKAAVEREKEGYETCDRITVFKGTEYYIAYNSSCPEKFRSFYGEEGIKEYEGFASTYDSLKDNIIIFPVPEKADKNMSSFASISAPDVTALQGEPVTGDIFKDYDLTMINIWATWCGPCVGEIPDLEKLYKELPENVNMITICIDGEEENETCLEILKENNVTFRTLAGDKEMKSGVLSSVTAFPTTVFADSSGKLVGSEVLGANKASEYMAEIEKRLDTLK